MKIKVPRGEGLAQSHKVIQCILSRSGLMGQYSRYSVNVSASHLEVLFKGRYDLRRCPVGLMVLHSQ